MSSLACFLNLLVQVTSWQADVYLDQLGSLSQTYKSQENQQNS